VIFGTGIAVILVAGVSFVLVLFVAIISIISSIVVLTHLIVVVPVAFSRRITKLWRDGDKTKTRQEPSGVRTQPGS
jgi:predicted tellurium resistance membrane protein TerC